MRFWVLLYHCRGDADQSATHRNQNQSVVHVVLCNYHVGTSTGTVETQIETQISMTKLRWRPPGPGGPVFPHIICVPLRLTSEPPPTS